MLKKTISIFFLLAAGFLLFLAARGLTNLGPPNQIEDIDTLKREAIEFIRQDKQIDANTAIKTILAEYGGDAKLSSVVYDIAEAYRNSSKFAKSIELYKLIVQTQPASKEAALAQSGLAISSVAIGNIEGAKTELEKLKTNYANEPNIAQLVFNVGDSFYWFKRYGDANNVYKYVIESYPASDYALWATMGLAISSIANKDEAAAQGYIDKLTADYAENPRLAEALFYVAGRYGYEYIGTARRSRFYKASAIYKAIETYWPESNWAKNSYYQTAKIDIMQYIKTKDLQNTLAAINKLIIDFSGRSDLSAAALDYALRSDTRSRYEPNEFTESLYNYIIERFPSTPQANLAGLALKRLDFIRNMDKDLSSTDSPADVNIPEAIDRFIDDNNGLPDYKHQVFLIGQHYYMKANMTRGNGKKLYFDIAAAVWERMLEKLPVFNDTVQAYYSLGACYMQIGDLVKSNYYHYKVAEEYPENSLAQSALHKIGQNYQKMWTLPEGSGPIAREEAFSLMKDTYRTILDRYPGGSYAKIAERILGQYRQAEQGGQ